MIRITREDALEYHRLGGKPGKIAIVPTKPMATQRDLGLAYTPGVAVPVLEIETCGSCVSSAWQRYCCSCSRPSGPRMQSRQ